MQCPVCGTPAENLTPGNVDGLIVRCVHCGEYEIVGTAVNDLLRMQLIERADALEKARRAAPPGARPAIGAT